jgi:uncharacterized cupredoxin-like copper-binding protein
MAIAIGVLLLLGGGCGRAESVAGSADDAAAPRVSETTDHAMSSEHMADTASEHGMMSGDKHSGDMPHMFAFGAPAKPADADRVVDVETVEEGGFHYDPDSIDLRVGETVTFRVHNVGEAEHEFVLGDEAMQDTHEAEMQAMASDSAMMHDEPNAISVKPGETVELTWTFTTPTGLVYGCHLPGHYAAGMRGELTVDN